MTLMHWRFIDWPTEQRIMPMLLNSLRMISLKPMRGWRDSPVSHFQLQGDALDLVIVLETSSSI
jgi:hypothetical protein